MQQRLTRGAVAKRLRCSVGTVRRLSSIGKLSAKIEQHPEYGECWTFDASEVEVFAETFVLDKEMAKRGRGTPHRIEGKGSVVVAMRAISRLVAARNCSASSLPIQDICSASNTSPSVIAKALALYGKTTGEVAQAIAEEKAEKEWAKTAREMRRLQARAAREESKASLAHQQMMADLTQRSLAQPALARQEREALAEASHRRSTETVKVIADAVEKTGHVVDKIRGKG